jgi:hypothetical protein
MGLTLILAVPHNIVMYMNNVMEITLFVYLCSLTGRDVR